MTEPSEPVRLTHQEALTMARILDAVHRRRAARQAAEVAASNDTDQSTGEDDNDD